jgi:hypothetical protein
MKGTTETNLDTTLAAIVAGEDIARGDFVAVISEIIELPSFLWDACQFALPADQLIRLRRLPEDAGEPHKVIGRLPAVCLFRLFDLS